MNVQESDNIEDLCDLDMKKCTSQQVESLGEDLMGSGFENPTSPEHEDLQTLKNELERL